MSGFPVLSRRRRWILLALAITVVVLGVGLGVWFRPHTRPPAEPPMPDLSEVDSEVSAAIAAVRNKVLQKPIDGGAWGRLGMVLRAHDFGDEANRCFREAERLDPNEPRWPYLLGMTLVHTDPEAGILYLQRAVERCGDEATAPRLTLAEALLEQGRLDEARTHLDEARRREPGNPRVRLGLGRLAVLNKQWRIALEHLAFCAGDVHARRLAHILRAEAHTRLSEPEKARAEQSQAALATEDEIWPDPFTFEVLSLQCGLRHRLNQARDLFVHRQVAEGVRLLEETVTLYPKSTSAWLMLGDVRRQRGRLDRAEQAFREAGRIDPDSAEPWFHLGCIQALNHSREAPDSFRRAIRLKPDHTLAHFNLAHRLKEMGDTSGAADEFRAALRCRPDYAPAREALRELEKKTKP